MITKEYINVREMSIIHNVSAKSVLTVIKTIIDKTSNNLLRKNIQNKWEIHHLLLTKFKPKYSKKSRYMALTVDPCTNYSIKDIDSIMQFVFDNMDDSTIELNYVIEQKISNMKNHIHCYVTKKDVTNVIYNFKIAFGKMSYKKTHAYDLGGWKNYMQKLGNKIKILTLSHTKMTY